MPVPEREGEVVEEGVPYFALAPVLLPPPPPPPLLLGVWGGEREALGERVPLGEAEGERVGERLMVPVLDREGEGVVVEDTLGEEVSVPPPPPPPLPSLPPPPEVDPEREGEGVEESVAAPSRPEKFPVGAKGPRDGVFAQAGEGEEAGDPEGLGDTVL